MKEDLPFATALLDADDGGGLIEQPGVNVMVQGTPTGEELYDDLTASPVVQAHRFAQRAEEAARLADFAVAADLHLKAAKGFLKAAEQVRDHGVLASALLLLADSHAARAEEASVRERISRNEQLSSSSNRRDLPTPAEAYPAPGRGATEGGVLLTGGDRARQASVGTGVPPDMEDSIMRGPVASNRGRTSSSVPGDGGAANASAVAAEELVKKFRPQRDDLLELERQLAKLGLESKAGGTAGGRARHRSAGASPGAHLSSALGESFCLLNQSVIFGGGVGIAGGGGPGGAGAGGREEGVIGGNASLLAPQQQQQHRPSAMYSAASVREGSGVSSVTGGGGAAEVDGILDGVSEDGAVAARTQGGSSTGTEVAIVDGRRGDREARRRLLVPGEGNRSAADAGDRESSDAHQGEIMRLLTCLKTLGDENLALMKECEDRDRVRQESQAIREEMRRFQIKYQERFTLLKKTLDEVVRSYPLLAGQGAAMGATAPGGGLEGSRASSEEVQRLMQANRKLTAQVKKYERYYQELCQKADSKRKEQLAQAKAARQQQLARGPTSVQQQQASQQQQQQQQQLKTRQSTAPGARRPQRQHAFQGAVGTPLQPQQVPAAAATVASQQRQNAAPTQQQAPLATRRSSSAPASHQQQRKQVGAGVAAAGGGGASQTIPVFAQQHPRQTQPNPQRRYNQQQQPQQPMGRPGGGSGGLLSSYQGTGTPQVPAAGIARGVSTPLASTRESSGVVDRSAGLDDESDV